MPCASWKKLDALDRRCEEFSHRCEESSHRYENFRTASHRCENFRTSLAPVRRILAPVRKEVSCGRKLLVGRFVHRCEESSHRCDNSRTGLAPVRKFSHRLAPVRRALAPVREIFAPVRRFECVGFLPEQKKNHQMAIVASFTIYSPLLCCCFAQTTLRQITTPSID